MDQLERLVAIEAIKNVKARYWYSLDMKDWEGLRAVFTDDAIWDMRAEKAFANGEAVGELPAVDGAIAAEDDAVTVGGEAISDFIAAVVDGWTTVHHGHAPIIEVESAEKATAIWPLFDYIDDGERAMKAYGYYHEEYRPVDGEWLISYARLTRTRGDGEYPRAATFEQ